MPALICGARRLVEETSTATRPSWYASAATGKGLDDLEARELVEAEGDGGDRCITAAAEGGGQDGSSLVEEEPVAELARFDLTDQHYNVRVGEDVWGGQIVQQCSGDGAFRRGEDDERYPWVPFLPFGLEGIGGFSFEGGVHGPYFASGGQGVIEHN